MRDVLNEVVLFLHPHIIDGLLVHQLGLGGVQELGDENGLANAGIKN